MVELAAPSKVSVTQWMPGPFVLVELLAEISKVAILVMIFLAADSQVRKKSNTSNDLSNLRQLGLGFFLYESEVLQLNCTQPLSGHYCARSLVYKQYISNESFFASPLDELAREDPKASRHSSSINRFLSSAVDAKINAPGTFNPEIASNVAKHVIGCRVLTSEFSGGKVVVLHLRPTEVNN